MTHGRYVLVAFKTDDALLSVELRVIVAPAVPLERLLARVRNNNNRN